MWQKLSKCYPPQLELISLLLLALTFYVALSNYAALPESIPTHFNAQGIPDDWGDKGTIFLFPTLAALLIFLPMTFFNIWLAIVDNPKRLINLPKKRKEALTEAHAEDLRIFINRSLFLLKVLILGLMGYLYLEYSRGGSRKSKRPRSRVFSLDKRNNNSQWFHGVEGGPPYQNSN